MEFDLDLCRIVHIQPVPGLKVVQKYVVHWSIMCFPLINQYFDDLHVIIDPLNK